MSDAWMRTAAERLDVPELGEHEVETILDLARDVAHGTERRFAPLTAFLVGLAVGGTSTPRSEALADAAARLRAALGPTD